MLRQKLLQQVARKCDEMKKLAWSIIFISLIVVVSGLTVLTVVYTDYMLRVYLVMGLTAIIMGILYSIAWAIDEVMR